MKGRLLKKDMIFYSPGKQGRLFTYIADHYISNKLLVQTVALLEAQNRIPVRYIEERRLHPRPA